MCLNAQWEKTDPFQEEKKKNEDAEKTQKASNFTTFVLTVRGGGAFASSPLWLAWLTIAPLQWDTNVPDSRTRLSLHG